MLALFAAQAFAADMLVYQERPVAREYRAVRTSAYVEAAPLSCNDLLVEYRAPLYEPRTEILRFCEGQSYRYR
ncbi:hypothetical protein D3C87_2121050 [compost metagenome]